MLRIEFITLIEIFRVFAKINANIVIMRRLVQVSLARNASQVHRESRISISIAAERQLW